MVQTRHLFLISFLEEGFYFTIFRASGDTAAASDDSDKIRVMRSSDGILQLLPPLKLDKKFKR